MPEPTTWTTNRNVRIDDVLWGRVLDKAAEEGTTASAVVRRLLDEWVTAKV